MMFQRLVASLASAVMFAAPVTHPSDPFPEADAESVIVVEAGTMTVLYEQSADTVRPMGHMAKLMTVLSAAEALESGSISLTDTVTASPNANSQQGTQIWLEVGDKITAEELLKSIIIGNANDACVCLAEHISGTEEKHIDRLNKMADRLGMTSTHFADCTGMDPDTVSTAEDIAILCCELVKHDDLTDYFTTWLDDLECKDVELVNNNRLVRSYKGIVGLKVCASENAGECAAIAAKRRDMCVCTVQLGCSDRDSALAYAGKILDTSFDSYRLFSPDVAEELPKKLTVMNGRSFSVPVVPQECRGVLTASGDPADTEVTVDLPESIAAPVKKGQKLGTVTYTRGETALMTADIVAAKDVERIDMAFAFRRALFNLFSFG